MAAGVRRLSVLAPWLILAVLLSCARAEIVSGTVSSKSDYHFIGKFCFSQPMSTKKEDQGWLSLTFNTENSNKALHLVLFADDGSEDFFKVHRAGSSMSCEKKLTLAHTMRTFDSGFTHVAYYISNTAHETFWYIAIVRCGTDDTESNFNYRAEFINPGGLFQREFSRDQQWLPEFFMFMLFVLTVLAGVHVYGVVKLLKLKSYHTVVLLLSVCLVLKYLSVGMRVGIEISFAFSGVYDLTYKCLRALSTACDMGSELVFTLLLLVLATGWTISVRHLKLGILGLMLMGIYVFLYLLSYLWWEFLQDPVVVQYRYESFAGYLMCILRIFTMSIFLNHLNKTMASEDNELIRPFYKILGAYSLWFVTLPIFMLIAKLNYPWERVRIVNISEQLCWLIAFMGMNYIMWPTSRVRYYMSLQAFASDEEQAYDSEDHHRQIERAFQVHDISDRESNDDPQEMMEIFGETYESDENTPAVSTNEDEKHE